mmetsp:Transcript_15377/g.21413  ORF Transcript_15377/g.21413 Transcript_15377/m.21413 type:complete len:281 (-) Transcript_15377:157-999(-)
MLQLGGGVYMFIFRAPQSARIRICVSRRTCAKSSVRFITIYRFSVRIYKLLRGIIFDEERGNRGEDNSELTIGTVDPRCIPLAIPVFHDPVPSVFVRRHSIVPKSKTALSSSLHLGFLPLGTVGALSLVGLRHVAKNFADEINLWRGYFEVGGKLDCVCSVDYSQARLAATGENAFSAWEVSAEHFDILVKVNGLQEPRACDPSEDIRVLARNSLELLLELVTLVENVRSNLWSTSVKSLGCDIKGTRVCGHGVSVETSDVGIRDVLLDSEDRERVLSGV